jgi:hypothetical protein
VKLSGPRTVFGLNSGKSLTPKEQQSVTLWNLSGY